MLRSLIPALLLASLSSVLADEAILAPSNGTTVSPGQTVQLRWFSDDDDDNLDVSRFDVALIGLTQLGVYTPQDGGDGRRYVREQITLPNDLSNGEYYLGINELEANERNETALEDYDLTHDTPDTNFDSPVIIQIGRSFRKRAFNSRIAPILPRQNNIDDDEILHSPGNLTNVAAGSTFNFTYRVDDDDDNDGDDRTERVAVSLVRYWRGVQSGQATRTGERLSYEGDMTVPTGLPEGYYYIAVFDGDDDDNAENARPGSYEVTFQNSAQVNGDDVDISGPERPVILFVSGNGQSSSSSASQSQTTSGSVGTTSTNAGGSVNAASSAPAVATSTGAAGKMDIPAWGVVGALLAWAIL